MSLRADISISAPDQSLLLAVAVKAVKHASAEWAGEYRQEYTQHSARIRAARYFMLVSRERTYLWLQTKPGLADRLPDYDVPTREALAPVLDESRIALENISPAGLEGLVSTWLFWLARLSPDPDYLQHEHWLHASGLCDAIRNGSFDTAAAA